MGELPRKHGPRGIKFLALSPNRVGQMPRECSLIHTASSSRRHPITHLAVPASRQGT
jgi:hypothetical protein